MNDQNAKIRVMLVDDHEMVRVGLRTLLNQYPSVEVVGEAGSVASLHETVTQIKPDVLLLDIRLPDGNGLDACRQIQQSGLDIRIIILTSFADDNLISRAIQAGADGYLLKEIDGDGLVKAIETVASGNSILDPSVTKKVFAHFKNPEISTDPADKIHLLSAQELRVLALVAEGKTNKEIAQAMDLSDKTVKNYLSNLMDKLEMSRRSQAAAFFVQHSSQMR